MATLSEMIRELSNAKQAGQQTSVAQPQASQTASKPVSSGQTLSNAIKQLSNAQAEVNTLKEAYQGKTPSTNQGIKPTTVDSQTTQKATREEAGAAGVTKNTNDSLESFYSRRDETAGNTNTAQPASIKAAQSALNSKNADSTVKNTLLSYYSKREFESPITAQPLSNITPSRADNTIMGTAQTYAGAMGAGLANLGKKLTDVVYDNNNNVTGPGLTEYARNYYSDKSDDFLRANLSDAEYRAVTNALRTNADMRKQATAQRDAMDALQMTGREKLEQAENGLGKIGTTAVHVGSNVMEMTADRAITAALSFLGVPQKAAQYTPLYLRSMGASNLEARQSGATENQAFVYGNLAGALEVATETMLSPTNFAEAAYGKGWLGSGVGKEAIGTLSRRLAKSELGQTLIYMAGTLGAAGAEESLEEGVSGIFTPLIKRITYDPDAKFDGRDTADSMLTAFLATVLTGGAGVAQTSRASKVYNNPTTVNSLIDVAKETQDEKSRAYKFADSLAKAVDGGARPTSLEVADLVRYLNESGSKEQTNKLYQIADVDKTDSNAKAQLNAAVTYAMQEANELISDPANATQAATRNFDNNINILVNALVSEDVADVLKPSIAYTLQSANTTRQASAEGTPVGIRRGDTISYHTSQMANEAAPEGITGYDVVRRHDDGSVDYIWTDDFNGNAFPTITKQTTVSANGKVTDTTPKNATIINDKSTLVAPNYTGFDINQQRNNENYWKEGRKRTGLAYNITQMNNKTYFDNYMNMLRQADARAQQAQQEEVIDNGGSESVPGDTGRTGAVAAEERGGGVRETTWYDNTRARIDEFRRQYGDDSDIGKRAAEIEKLSSALQDQNAKEVDAKQFAGAVGGAEGTTVIPVTGKAAKQYASLTKSLKKLGARNVKYFVGALYISANDGTMFPVSGAYDGNGTVYVRLDSMYQSPVKLGRHEVFHLLCDKYKGLQEAAYNFLRNMFGDEAINKVIDEYLGAYEKTTADDHLIQEMLCDAFGNTHVLASQYGTNPFNEELVNFVNEYTNGESETTTEAVDATTEETQAEEITEPNVESTQPETENAEESTEENVNTAPESAAESEESTEENVNTEQQIQVQRTRNGEWENINRDQAIKYAKGLYKRLRNAYRDPSARLNAVNNTIRGYQVTAEDLGVQEEIATAQAENTETTAPSETQRNEVLAENREIWNEPNAKKKYKGRAKSPDNYQWEVVEAYENGSVDHVFFDTEEAAEGYARLRNSAHEGIPSAQKVDLTRAGALEHALSEVLREIEDIMDEDADYRVSVADQAALAEAGVGIDEETKVAYSLATWEETDYVKTPNAQAKILARNIGITQKQALAYIESINSVAAKIALDKTRWDYESAPGMSSYMNNAEYVKTIDFSTICKKRRLFSGTFSAIQKALPNTVFTADDLLEIRKSMQENAGLEVPCHMCFVEGSRIKMGEYANEFIKQFKAANPDAKWIPNMYDVNTPEGAEAMRLNHPDVYEQYNYFWNTQGRLEGFEHWKKFGRRPKSLSTPGTFSAQGKPKLFQAATAYDGEIVKYYGKDYDADVKTIREAKKNGTMDSAEAKAAKERVDRVDKINLFAGIRMQSFSDFEIIHLIDAMQVVMDLSVAGLKSHAYTKVGDFARALGQTGVKINLSLVAKGVDENGKLIFNEVEGMKWSEVEELRKQFPNTVGDIVVTFNDKQLMAAMADDRIDFIIPFHRSQWTKKQFNKMGLGTDSKDYAPYQKERWLNSKEHTHIGKKGEPVLTKIVQIPPMAYWDYSKTGEQNAEEYLRLCHEGGNVNGYEIEKGRRPKFYKLLVKNADGLFSLPADNSERSQAIRKGYWKLLIDFKMYDNEGKAAPFENVKPIFDVDTASQMLDSYEGGHRELPVAEDFANDYIEKFKKDHPNVKYSRALTTEADREYAKAVENGYIQDMYDAIDKAAKDAGYIYNGYHGTPDGGFTVFRDDDAIFLTDSRKMADTYRNADMNGDFPSDSQTYKLYAKMENPLVINGYKQDIYGVSWSDVHYSDPIIEQAEDLNTILEDTYMSYASDPLGEIKGSSAIEWGDYKDLREFVGEDRFDSAREKIDELLKEWSFENDDRGDIGSEAWRVFEDEIFYPVRTRSAENGLNVSGTRNIVKVAEREGYDGIIIKGITDYGGVPSDGDYEPATVYVVFNASQVKSGELITYDDNGDIIPPSQRFDETNNDIRYSRMVEDEEYSAAVENNPVEARKILQAKAEENGYTYHGYHGTPLGGFSKFNSNQIWLTPHKAMADTYHKNSPEGYTYDLYARMNNPLVVDAKEHAWKSLYYMDKTIDEYERLLDQVKSGGTVDWTDTENLQKALGSFEKFKARVEKHLAAGNNTIARQTVSKDMYDALKREYQYHWGIDLDGRYTSNEIVDFAQKQGYDGVIFNNMYDYTHSADLAEEDEVPATVYVVFGKQNVKSANLMTYGYDGWEIPLSERFNDRQQDIRFSRAFDEVSAARAIAETNYAKTIVNNFNGLEQAKKASVKAAPSKVAKALATKYNSSVKTEDVKKAVGQMNKYIAEKIAAGSEVSYDTLRDMADPIARHAVMNNKSLTDTDGYKTYSKLVDYIDKTTIAVSGNISRNIDNYKGWVTANLDNINVDKTGIPIKAAYDSLNKMFGDNLFPTNLKQYEMLQRIAEVVGNYRTIYENPYNFNVDIASIYATNDIINEVLQTPGNIALGEINLEDVLKNVNDSRREMLAEMGEAYEKGEPVNVTRTEAYRQARTSATEDINAKQITLEEREWRTTPTRGAEGREVLSPTDVIAKMESTLGFNITEGHIKKRGVLGVFYRRNRGIRIMLDNDLPTSSHELGHALDLKYKVEAGLTDAMKDELLTKHDAATRALINDPRYSDSERIGEAIAEYNRVFLTNKDDAFNRFPLFSKYYLNKMDEDDRANLIALADNINAYYVKAAKTAQPSIRLMSQGRPDFRPWQEKLEDLCTHLYQVWVDSNYAIKKYISDPTGSDAYIRATNAAYADARAGQIITGQLFSKDGTFVSGGLTAALEEINLNDDAEYLAFGEYLVVKHGPEFRESTGGHVFANPIEDNPNWMRNRAKELEEQYPQFKESAEKLYKFQNDFLMEYAVKTGILSKETYEDWTQNYVVKVADKNGKSRTIPVKIVETDDGKGTVLVDENGKTITVEEGDYFHKARWQYYVPFNRVLARTGKGQLVANKNGYANQTGVFHGAHGSTKDLYHPVDNIMRNIIKITKAGINNDVGLAIADAALKHNIDAQYLAKITPTMKQQLFYTEQLKKSLLRQLEEADAYGKTEIDEDSYDVFENIIAQMDAVVAQYTPGNPVGDHIVVMRNGKEEWWHINDHMLLESMTRLNPKRIDGFFGTLAVMSRFMTSNITGNNLIWSISRNAPKDLGTLIQYSPTKSPIKIFGGIAQAYRNSVRDNLGEEVDPFYLEYLAMGGGKTSAYTSDINTADRSRKQMRVKAVTQKTHKVQMQALIKTPIEAIEVFSDTVELGPRYATYRAMRMDGKNPHEAFYDACDVTVNFRRGGYLARQVNMVTPFFNANVQGIDKFFRYFTASDVKAGDKAKVLAGRAAFFVAHSAILAGITMALNYRDKKKKKEYEQLSAFTKNNYWCIPADIANRFGGFFGKKLKSGEFIALPKPRELGILSSFMERCLEATMWENENAFSEFSTYLTGNLLPAYLQELADGIIDKNSTGIGKLLTEGGTNLGIIGVGVYLYANKDFLGRPIVSEALLDYEKKDQYTGKTSLPAYYIAQAFAKYGQGLSPQQIDFIGNQVFSNVWKPMQALFPKDEFYRDESLGVWNAWIKDNQQSNDLVNWLYDHADESLRAHNSEKENGEKSYRYAMDDRMKSFYGAYNGLTKEMDETEESRTYKQKVLDMLSDYRESVDNGIPISQKTVHDLVVKTNKTSILPAVLKPEVKDANGKTIDLDYKQYYQYQTNYTAYYYDMANDVLGLLSNDGEKADTLERIKTLAKASATDDILRSMGKSENGDLSKYKDVNVTNAAIFQTYWRQLSDNDSISQEEATLALQRMDWLTPHEKAVLWQTGNAQWKTTNNPWRKYL